MRYHSVPPPTCLLSSTGSSQVYVDGTFSVPRTGILSCGEAIPRVQEDEDPFGHLNLDSFGASQPRASQPIQTQEAPSMASKVSELLQAARSIEEEQR